MSETQERVVYPLSAPIRDVKWNETKIGVMDEFCEPDTLWWAYVENGSRLTVLRRTTGLSFESIDVESGFRDAEGKFWLASGMCDVRLAPEVETVADAIKWVKAHSNNCKGD